MCVFLDADVGVLGFDPLAFERQVFGRGRAPRRSSRRCGRPLCRRIRSSRRPAPGSAAAASVVAGARRFFDPHVVAFGRDRVDARPCRRRRRRGRTRRRRRSRPALGGAKRLPTSSRPRGGGRRSGRSRRGGSAPRRSARRAPRWRRSPRPGAARAAVRPRWRCRRGVVRTMIGSARGRSRRSGRRPSAAAASRARAEPAGRVGQRHQHHHRREREDDEAAAVEEGGVLVGPPDHQRDDQPGRRRRAPSSVLRAPAAIRRLSLRLGQTIARAAPKSSPTARVSVP